MKIYAVVFTFILLNCTITALSSTTDAAINGTENDIQDGREKHRVFNNIRIQNLTGRGYKAKGRISYWLCSPDDYEIDFAEETDIWRGTCLITKITAEVFNSQNYTTAEPYTSFGSWKHMFEIVKSDNGFKVKVI